jgi:hypothetical protein
MSEEKPRSVPRRDRGDAEEVEFGVVHPSTAGPIEFLDEVETIDPWDDILDDGRIKYRSVREAYEAGRKEREKREDNDE